MIKFTSAITKAINIYISIGFTVFYNPGIILACSIIVIPIISLEDTEIIFASVNESTVSPWSAYYNYVSSLANTVSEYGIKSVQVVSRGIYTVTNGAVIGLGILTSACIVKNPIVTAGVTKDLIVNTFAAIGKIFTNQENLNLPASIVIIGSVAVFGICIGVGNKLYERYISTIVKPIEVMPQIEKIDTTAIQSDVTVTYIQNLNYLVALLVIMLILYIIAVEMRLMKQL